jgi:hypothetical protein
MSKSLLLISAFTLALGATGAWAQEAPRDGHHHDMPTDAQRAAWHHERCADRYAHRVAMLAYIETRLALTDSQRPAFGAWKSIVLSDAKSGAGACADHPHDMNGPPSIVDREWHMETMMKARVAFLDAELPALTALYQTLTPEQKMVLDHGQHGHGHGPHDHGMDRHHGPDGEDDGAKG